MCLKTEQKCCLCLLEFDWSCAYYVFVLSILSKKTKQQQFKTVAFLYITWNVSAPDAHDVVLLRVFFFLIVSIHLCPNQTEFCFFFSCFMFKFLDGSWPDAVFMALWVILKWQSSDGQTCQADQSRLEKAIFF